MFNPSDHKGSYASEKQEAASSGFIMPDSGLYDVVNTHIQKMIVGQNSTEKRRVRVLILKAVENDAGTVEDLKQFEGVSFSIDLWWNMEKQGNAKRLAHMAAACGAVEAFDHNDSASLVAAITGIPYRMKHRVKEYEHKGKPMRDADPVYTTHLPKAKRAGYIKDPDFKKLIGAPEDRILEDKDYSKPRSAPNHSDPQARETTSDPFDDNDLPF